MSYFPHRSRPILNKIKTPLIKHFLLECPLAVTPDRRLAVFQKINFPGANLQKPQRPGGGPSRSPRWPLLRQQMTSDLALKSIKRFQLNTGSPSGRWISGYVWPRRGGKEWRPILNDGRGAIPPISLSPSSRPRSQEENENSCKLLCMCQLPSSSHWRSLVKPVGQCLFVVQLIEYYMWSYCQHQQLIPKYFLVLWVAIVPWKII